MEPELTDGQIKNAEFNLRRKNYRRFRAYNMVTTGLVVAAGIQLTFRHGWWAYLAVIPALFLAEWIGTIIFKQEFKTWPFGESTRDPEY